jgi:hypothetical protein
MNRALGRKPHDSTAVALAPKLQFHKPPVPAPHLDRAAVAYQPKMSGNADYPDCVIAGILNAALAQEALATNGPLAFDDDCWIKIYAECAGCAPTLAAIAETDGLNVLDTLRRLGHGFNVGAQTPLFGDFGVVPLDRNHLAAGAEHMGCIVLGVELSQSDMDAPHNAVWTASPGDPSMGHCGLLWDYLGLGDTDLVGFITWGGFQEVTWGWIEARTQEAYALLLPMCQPANVDTVKLAQDNKQWLRAA